MGEAHADSSSAEITPSPLTSSARKADSMSSRPASHSTTSAHRSHSNRRCLHRVRNQLCAEQQALLPGRAGGGAECLVQHSITSQCDGRKGDNRQRELVADRRRHTVRKISPVVLQADCRKNLWYSSGTPSWTAQGHGRDETPRRRKSDIFFHGRHAFCHHRADRLH